MRHEMDAKFTEPVAEAMRAHKTTEEKLWKNETRYHPQLPEQEDIQHLSTLHLSQLLLVIWQCSKYHSINNNKGLGLEKVFVHV